MLVSERITPVTRHGSAHFALRAIKVGCFLLGLENFATRWAWTASNQVPLLVEEMALGGGQSRLFELWDIQRWLKVRLKSSGRMVFLKGSLVDRLSNVLVVQRWGAFWEATRQH
jgi:hypothetical protein